MPVAIRVIVDRRRMEQTFGAAAFLRRHVAAMRSVGANFKAEVLTGDLIPRNTGALRASINAGPFVSPGGRTVMVGTPFAYGIVMERGRAPGRRRPPMAPIILWVRRKLHPPAKQVRRIAYAIARKIGLRGIAIPLSGDGRGGMFRAAWAKVGTAVLAKWYAIAFGRAK